MLAYILALAVGLGSLGIYLAAFFFPEVHRKNDFIWSGVGLFYALVLWVCAGKITGGLLLGQLAGVALLGWSVTQTLQLRRQLTPVQQQTELPSAVEVKSTVQDKISNLSLPQKLSQLGKRVTGSATTAKDRLQENLTNLNQRQSQSAAAPGSTSTTSKDPATATDHPSLQVIDNRSSKQPESTTATEATELKESPLGAEPAVNLNQPAGPDMPGQSGKVPIPVEEIAPEAELAPPSEPLGAGDPLDRQNPPPPSVAMEAVPVEIPQTEQTERSPDSESSPAGDVPEPIRPNPPNPEVVEAAIHDAEEKGEEVSPPGSVDSNSTNSVVKPKKDESN